MGDYGSAGDNCLPENDKGEMLFETPATLNDTWGYKAFDNNWKSADKVLEMLHTCNANGANLLLNVGPDYLGRIPVPTIDILREVGQQIK